MHEYHSHPCFLGVVLATTFKQLTYQDYFGPNIIRQNAKRLWLYRRGAREVAALMGELVTAAEAACKEIAGHMDREELQVHPQNSYWQHLTTCHTRQIGYELRATGVTTVMSRSLLMNGHTFCILRRWH